jgi:membrane associated rhomboid family serine protease
MENLKPIKFGLLTRAIITFVTLFFLLSHLNKNFTLIYANITLFTFNSLEIYRLLTSIFICENIFDYFFNIFVTLTILNFTENKEGTSKTTIRFILYTLLFQLLTNFFAFIIYFIHPVVLSNIIKPLPAISLTFIVRNILLTESRHIQVYKGIEFNNRWLMIFTLVLFLIGNFNEFKFEALIAIVYGFLVCKFRNYFDYFIVDENIQLFEKSENYKSLVTLDGFITLDGQQYGQQGSQIATNEEVKDDIEIIDVDI